MGQVTDGIQTMENTKQKAIRLAYGEYFEEMKPFINKDGWFDKNAFWNNTFSFGVYENIDLFFTHKEDFMIPTSISNIETNNGWIRIESEKDLPSENGKYWIKDKSDSIEICGFDKNDYSYLIIWKTQFTHYQPIVKPLKPIY